MYQGQGASSVRSPVPSRGKADEQGHTIGLTMLGLVFLVVFAFIGVTQTIHLHGGGASFPSAVYLSWASSYEIVRNQFADVTIDFEVVGSGRGKAMIKSGEYKGTPVIFAGSDSLLTEEEYQAYPDLQMLPIIAGSVVLSYNIPGFTDRLVLCRETIVGIYNGTIRRWNDPLIQRFNPNSTLPDKEIIVIVRLDKSGTTEIFTSALSAISPEWNATYGTFSKGGDSNVNLIHWNASVVNHFGYTGRGISGLILSLQYSIGYLSLADASGSELKFAQLINQAGNTIAPTTKSVQNAMDDFLGTFDSRFTTSLIDAPGEFSYPLAAYSYMIIYMTDMTNCNTAVELVRFIEWCLYDDLAQQICDQKHMVCISGAVADKVNTEILEKLTCNGGQSVSNMVTNQKAEERRSLELWRTPLYISLPISLVLVLVLVANILHYKLKKYKNIISGKWKIDTSDLCILGGDTKSKVSVTVSSTNTLEARGSRGPFSFTEKIAIYNGVKLSLQKMERVPHDKLRWATMDAIMGFKKSVKDVNVCTFYGVAIVDETFYFAREFCAKGVLQDVLLDAKLQLDINFKHSMAVDVCRGMVYLEKKGIIHGYLSSQCCYLDGRWNVKIADWEISKLQSTQLYCPTRDVELYGNGNYSHLLWAAPEVLKFSEGLTCASDVYSFAVIVHEIFTRRRPYSEQLEFMIAEDLLSHIVGDDIRPELTVEIPRNIHPILKMLWAKSPDSRPNFATTLKLLTRTRKTRKCVLDCMMDAMTAYMNTLEEKVSERTRELEAAMTRVQTVLHQILPPAVADKLSRGEAVAPEYFETVTVFFSDIVGFTSIVSSSTPLQVVDFLNSLYTIFDSIIDKHDVYKVETIGDAYMVISGLPKRNGIAHVHHIANMALDITEAVGSCRVPHMPKRPVELRAGFHSGPVTAGVVGMKMPRYCLFGDTVNVASRMESTSLPMRIQITPSSQKLLSDTGGFVMQERGETDIKGKGTMMTYWLIERRLTTKGKPSHEMYPPQPSVQRTIPIFHYHQ